MLALGRREQTNRREKGKRKVALKGKKRGKKEKPETTKQLPTFWIFGFLNTSLTSSYFKWHFLLHVKSPDWHLKTCFHWITKKCFITFAVWKYTHYRLLFPERINIPGWTWQNCRFLAVQASSYNEGSIF